MSDRNIGEISITGKVGSVARINGKLKATQIVGSVGLGREVMPRYIDVMIRFPTKNDFPPIGDERRIYVDMSNMAMYLWTAQSSYVAVTNSDFDVNSFDPGELASIVVEDGIASFTPGTLPSFDID